LACPAQIGLDIPTITNAACIGRINRANKLAVLFISFNIGGVDGGVQLGLIP
jgi:hypothetical protein